MNTMELEVHKAGLAKAILGENDETLINKLWMFLEEQKSSMSLPKAIKRNRNIGILEGKTFFHEVGNGKITTEEFLGL